MLLRVHEISKQYPDAVGLEPLSFTLKASHCLGIVGESGSGKTTILQILAGFLPSDTGEMYLYQKRLPSPQYMLVKGYPDIQLVPQDFKLLPNHKVWENITYPIRHYPQKDIQERLHYLAEILYLKDFLARYPKELSGGQQQRVAIARALANEPAILLLDEPFNQADNPTKYQLEQILAYLKTHTRTALVIVTHQASEALGLSDTVLVLKAGKMLQYDTPKRIYETPQDSYVGKLWGYINPLPEAGKAIRAEHCHFSYIPTELACRIKHIFYEGFRYRYTLEMDFGAIWEVYHTHLLAQEQSVYYMDFQKNQVLHF